MGPSSLPAAVARITSIGVVGAILNRGARLRGWPIRPAKRWISAQERFCVKRPHMAEIVTRVPPKAKAGAGAAVTCGNPIFPQSAPVSFQAFGLAPATPFQNIARARA